MCEHIASMSMCEPDASLLRAHEAVLQEHVVPIAQLGKDRLQTVWQAAVTRQPYMVFFPETSTKR